MNQTPYIPNTGIDYPADPFQGMVDTHYDSDFKFSDNYPYLDDSLDYKWNQFLCYAGLFSFAFYVNRLKYGLKIVGRRNFTSNRKLFKNGGMSVCNHVYRWDMLCILDALRYRKMKIMMLNKHFLGKDIWFLRSIGGIPLPDDTAGVRKFNEAFDEYNRRKEWIHIFPEARRWDFYAPIRPFKLGAFTMAYKYNLPIMPLCITYRERKGLYKFFGKGPCVTIHVGTPVIPDTTSNRKIECERLRQECHAQMVKMAGFEGTNPWPANYDNPANV